MSSKCPILRELRSWLIANVLSLADRCRRELEPVPEQLGVAQVLLRAVVQQLHWLVCEVQRLPEVLQSSALLKAARLTGRGKASAACSPPSQSFIAHRILPKVRETSKICPPSRSR